MPPRTHVLIIGGGSIGERHVRCFLQTGRARVSLCDTNSAVGRRLAERYQIAGVFDSLEAALGEPYDAAVIATPAHLHVEMARRLLEAGCHVLIEKPLSTSTEGLAALKAAAAKPHRAVGVGYVQRHSPMLQVLRGQVLEGTLGEPLEVICTSGQDFAALRPAYRDTYYRNHQTGGGAIQDALTHWINTVEWIVGATTRVAAQAAHLALEGVTVEDTVHVLAQHGSVLACYTLNQHQAPNESSLTVHCRDGSLRGLPHANRWMSMRRGASDWQVFEYESPGRDAAFVAQAKTFLDAAESNAEPACTLDEAAQTLATCLAILQSSKSGASIEVVNPLSSS